VAGANVNLAAIDRWNQPESARSNFDRKAALRYVKGCGGLSDRVLEQWGKR
jgi:hypothetical protein